MQSRFSLNLYRILISAGLALGVYLICTQGLNPYNWGLYATVILLLALLWMYRWSEGAAVTSKEITLAAALAGAAAVGRVPFAALPGVQPTTFLVMVSGFVFGPQIGFIVGATAALVSNFFLGQGPWTPWQMMGWGLVGWSSAYIRGWRPDVSRWTMAVFAGLWGFIFGWIQNLGFWVVYIQPLTIKSFLAAYAASFFFDLAHAVSNVLLCLLFFPAVVRVLEDYQQRLHHSYIDTSSED